MKKSSFFLLFLIVGLSSCMPVNSTCDDTPCTLVNYSDKKNIIVDIDSDGSTLVVNIDGVARTLYTLTNLGEASPTTPSANDWIPLAGVYREDLDLEPNNNKGQIILSDELIEALNNNKKHFGGGNLVLDYIYKDKNGVEHKHYTAEGYRSSTGAQLDKSKHYQGLYNAIFEDYWLYYFMDGEPNPDYWQEVTLDIINEGGDLGHNCCKK
jgi:hypothetical protein